MTTNEYFEIKNRMTNRCGISCGECLLGYPYNHYGISCTRFEIDHPDEAIAIVEKWGKEHPTKTLMDKFFEVFPDAPRNKFGMPEQICVRKVGYKSIGSCQGVLECLKCWSQPYIEPNIGAANTVEGEQVWK